MLLKYNCIYGYYEEGNKIFLANHSSDGDISGNFGIYLCTKLANRIEPISVNFATQINPPFDNCLFTGNFGNIISVEEFIFVPYYNRIDTNKWDTIVKYSKNDLTLLKSKTIQSKGIIQSGSLINQTVNISFDGLWKPVLTSIDNFLYYLIDNIIFIIEPNYLSIIGEMILDNFSGCAIAALSHKGRSWLAVVNETQVRFYNANKKGRNIKTMFIADINSIGSASPTSISISSIDMIEDIPAKICILDSSCGIVVSGILDTFTDLDNTQITDHIPDIGKEWVLVQNSTNTVIKNNKAWSENLFYTKHHFLNNIFAIFKSVSADVQFVGGSGHGGQYIYLQLNAASLEADINSGYVVRVCILPESTYIYVSLYHDGLNLGSNYFDVPDTMGNLRLSVEGNNVSVFWNDSLILSDIHEIVIKGYAGFKMVGNDGYVAADSSLDNFTAVEE
jgi:hypothetical protein